MARTLTETEQNYPLGAGVAPASAKNTTRIVGLDVMRALLLSYGVFVHTSNLKIEPVFVMIEESSALFRMSTFFFLSGLLTALTIGRATPGKWLRTRLLALGVPLCFGLAVLNPLFFMVQVLAPKRSFMVGFLERNHMNWHLHLWFLFCLVFFSILAFLIHAREVGRRAKPAPFDISAPPTVNWLVLIGLLLFPLAQGFASFVAWRMPLNRIGLSDFTYIFVSTVDFLPYYLLGFMATRWRSIPILFSSRIYWLVGLWAIPMILLGEGLIDAGARFSTIIDDAGEHACRLLFILATVPLFLKIRKAPAFLLLLSRSAYTLYIIHLLLISICLYSLAYIGLDIYLTALLTIIIVFFVCLVFHVQVVERFRLARFLFNGKWQRLKAADTN